MRKSIPALEKISTWVVLYHATIAGNVEGMHGGMHMCEMLCEEQEKKK